MEALKLNNMLTVDIPLIINGRFWKMSGPIKLMKTHRENVVLNGFMSIEFAVISVIEASKLRFIGIAENKNIEVVEDTYTAILQYVN